MRWLLSSTLMALGFFGMTDLANGFDSQGHRGARGLMPENTLASFAKALSIGVNTLELDVGATSDGAIVVTHNPRLEPETTRNQDGQWLDETGPGIRSLTLKELKSFDVGRVKPGTRYHERFSDQTAVDGARIPTLEEVLHLIRRSGNENVRLNIETKLRPTEPELFLEPREFVSSLLKIIHQQGFSVRVTIQSFDWRTLQETQRQAPNIPTSYLTVQQDWYDNLLMGKPGPSPWTAGHDIDNYAGNVPEMVKKAGGQIWSAFHPEMTAEKVKQAHDLGLKVKVWTVNDTDRMEALIDMGVDGIITDYPDRLRGVLEKRGMPLPKQTPVSP
ncbi:MAG: glycerophosphodiester phosphodiesterase [Rhodospirillaceae bacterium]|jgi:glycerophosphoryl diester phosphodiesterase|nr:glycerophosphodiester phosphodiesterase [Rhodospirillaceae bacterium]MBT5245243.1 glycerophosphodiester phosphodiesterase [Rhodospirillaceae bacterium]MBT5562774.1 glycerophosphodiester phosphodiesterase [Rhodospirillaceae bacterium]MBT6240703.1 glycerophosphodiester phosphodiesterase [Rhodospirillaceae bacterium]